MTKPRRGGKYERKDGSTIADDHTDRRFHRLFAKAAEPKKDVGDTRHKQDSSLKDYLITFKNGKTQHVSARSEQAVRKQFAKLGIKDIELMNKRKK